MRKSTHFYSLNSEWQYRLTCAKDNTILNKEIIVLPETLGKGKSYFTQITSGISVLFIDFNLTKPIKINHTKSDNDFYIFHFDLSEKTSSIKINDIDYKTGVSQSSGLTILSSDVDSSFSPPVGCRTLVLRLLIDKILLNGFLKNHQNEGPLIQEIETNNEPLHYHDTIDSNSIVLIESIRKKSFIESLFDSYLKGASLKILGNFLNRYSDLKEEKNEITDTEKKAISATRDYLVKNLHNPFPSILFLSKMAHMSSSRYIYLFKLKYKVTPNIFFTQEKMLLSNTLLKSGNYSSLTEIIYELNYNRLSYFSSKYYSFFNRKPSDDFVKRVSIQL
ncbi:helix-turn-helix transcriptional regulator [Flavobacterium sp. LPB0248]|uniref:helix-turn-helix domain-containing protein n=1 Tax=Flavobacterium sp. LPB0248 TaxID=2614441 RepID=UPI0015A55397|nr:AraC family transcriptional regulator [Flavobacterium sp. LPB0248]QLC66333.1 helix-turn-helix transcriptional regulator [Flavobacterium sp. LPB0248]